MLKALFLIASLASTFLYADYYTSTDSSLNSEKTLIFDDQLTFIISNDNIKIHNSKKLDWISFEPNHPRIYQKKVLVDKEKHEKLYNVYNFAYLLKNIVRDEMFLVRIPKGFLVVHTEIKNKEVSSKLSGKDVDVYKYEYEVQSAFDNNFKDMEIEEKDILTKYIDNYQNLVAIDILDDGIKKLIKSVTPQLTHFLKEKENRLVIVKDVDFSGEKLYLTYVSKKESSQKRMSISYEMKRKNIKTTLKTPRALFDPNYKGSSVTEHVGLMRDTGKALYEMKKVEISNGSIDLTWINNPKKSVVIVNFLNAGEKDKKILSKNKGQQFYAIEGVIYLATWMKKHNADSRVFTFMNGDLPFDVTMIKTSNNVYEMQKKSQTIYTFKMGKNNLVQTISYPAYDIRINLEQIDNDTTLKNKQFLESYVIQNNIKFIKE